MSAYPSLRPIYLFPGWVIANVKIASDIGIVRLRVDERYNHPCPVCGKLMAENRRIWQPVRDLPLGTANLVQSIYQAMRFFHL